MSVLQAGLPSELQPTAAIGKAGKSRDSCPPLSLASGQSAGQPIRKAYFALALGAGFGSRLAFRSAAVIFDSIPPAGTSAFATHASALRIVLRKSSFPQLS